MKKFLALSLSLLMVFSIIPLAIAASADESTYTKVLDFDTVLTDAVPVSTNSSNVTGGVIDYSEVDSSYTDGNVIKMAGKQWQNYGFFIGDVLQGKKVKTISYTIWSDATGTINTNGRTGISDNVSSIKLTTRTHLGLTENIATTTTPATVTYDLSALTPSLYNTIGNAILVFCNDSTNTVVYIDNIVITYEKYAGTFSGSADGDQVIYADENGKLTTPNATIAEGEFAGWVTEDDADTLIPANTEITLTDDITYFAVSSTREEQLAPEAPVVESKTADSVTLVANSAYQYSKDGTNWQDSNVFSSLSPATTYTFYQRLKSTPTKYASPSSEGTSVETLAVYTFEAENVYTGSYTGTLNPKSSNNDTSTGSLIYVVHDSSNPAVGHYVTYKFTDVTTGYYRISLFSRNVSGSRSTYSVTAFDETGEEQSAGSIDFGDLTTKVGSNSYYCNPTLTENVLVSSGSDLTLKFTISKTGTSSGSYIDKFVLTKVADYVPEEKGAVTDALSTSATASIRLGTVCGIRFYTTFDTSKIEGTIVEKGTLIGPKDKIGDYLTIEDAEITDGAEVGNAVAVPYLSNTLWANNEFVGSIVGIKDTNYNREFTARAYVKLEDGTYLYSATSTTKTVADIADAFVAGATKVDADPDNVAKYEQYKGLVDAWAAAND